MLGYITEVQLKLGFPWCDSWSCNSSKIKFTCLGTFRSDFYFFMICKFLGAKSLLFHISKTCWRTAYFELLIIRIFCFKNKRLNLNKIYLPWYIDFQWSEINNDVYILLLYCRDVEWLGLFIYYIWEKYDLIRIKIDPNVRYYVQLSYTKWTRFITLTFQSS